MLSLVVAAVALTNPSSALAQDNGDVNISGGQAGVAVDAEGVLRMQTFADPGGRLTRQRIAAAKATLGNDLTRVKDTIYISLNRLEKAVVDRQGVPTDEMKYLAGLQRVKHVFYFPETKDIVIAGPAEGWMTQPSGRVVGLKSGRPVVQLQDLVVALRAFAPGQRATGLIGCSIDPTEEGLAAMQRFIRGVGPLDPRRVNEQVQYITNGMRNSMGLRDVRVDGVAAGTHFAQVLVEADYRMKLIGIGLEKPPVNIGSYVKFARSSGSLQRWFFVPDYECVRVSEDGLAMELVGDGVKLVGESEMVNAQGQRKVTGATNRASQLFVNSFTKNYGKLADVSPIYAELRNVIDLSVAAAHIQKEDYYKRSGWNMDFFGDESKFSVQTYNPPKKVGSALNVIFKGGRLMVPIAGGVNIQAKKALNSENLLEDENQRVEKLRKGVELKLAEGQWWWD